MHFLSKCHTPIRQEYSPLIQSSFTTGRDGRKKTHKWNLTVIINTSVLTHPKNYLCSGISGNSPNMHVGYISNDAPWHPVPDIATSAKGCLRIWKLLNVTLSHMTHDRELYSFESDTFDWHHIISHLECILLKMCYLLLEELSTATDVSYWLRDTCWGLFNPLGPFQEVGKQNNE
jgi:hypothetical protein